MVKRISCTGLRYNDNLKPITNDDSNYQNIY